MFSLISLFAAGLLLAESAAMAAPTTPGGVADAEARACTGIAADDRNKGPFERAGGVSIESVEPLIIQEYPRTNPPIERVVGAVVTVRAEQGMTAERLQRVADCFLAHNAALGNSAPEMPDSPLGLRGVVTNVRSSGDGFAVEIRSDERDVARDILARAERLPR
jgi:hypothetical protein